MRPESDFPPASSDCTASPAWWHTVDQQSTEIEVTDLVAGLVRGLQPEMVVETGSYCGQTSAAIGYALARNGHGELICVEVDPVRALQTRGMCRGLPVSVVNANAHSWTPSKAIDLLFVDDGHPIDRSLTLNALLSYCSPRALVVVHDAGTQSGLRPALLDLEASGQWRLILLPTPRGVALLRPAPGTV